MMQCKCGEYIPARGRGRCPDCEDVACQEPEEDVETRLQKLVTTISTASECQLLQLVDALDQDLKLHKTHYIKIRLYIK